MRSSYWARVDRDSLTPLIGRCRAGDELAWEAFVRQAQGRIFALAYSYLNDREEARDLAQEIFIRLFETRDRWPDDAEFVPWLIHVARNRSVDYLRRRKARVLSSALPEEHFASVPDPSAGPEREAVFASQRKLLRTALRRLSAISREVLMLRDIQGLSVEEVSDLLGVPEGTVKSRASRARIELSERVLALSRRGGAGGTS
ncbi:MAG: sigma-70 family RNA polymerase sigma factor [Acidobacteriota bacterium]